MEYNKKEHSISGIYSIVNIVNNKRYIGKSKNIYLRIKNHIGCLNGDYKKHENEYLRNSWKKHGRSSFKLEIIENLPLDEEILKIRELYWIDKFDTTNRNFGYNLRRDSETKMLVSDETRLKLSKAGVNRYKNIEERKKVSIASTEFWKNNPNTLLEMRKKVSLNHRKNNIVQFDKNMNFIKEYEGRHDILLNYPNLYAQAILSVCNGSKKSYQGFLWRYRNLETNLIKS